jgi:hypothetical protein
MDRIRLDIWRRPQFIWNESQVETIECRPDRQVNAFHLLPSFIHCIAVLIYLPPLLSVPVFIRLVKRGISRLKYLNSDTSITMMHKQKICSVFNAIKGRH